jgi:hypothetical protein
LSDISRNVTFSTIYKAKSLALSKCLSFQRPQLYSVKLNFCPFVFVSFFFNRSYYRHFNKRYFASLTCVFYLRHSSNWNHHRLHSEPFPPKEKHNVGPLRFDDDHDHICYRFAQVRIFGGKSNVFRSLQYLCRTVGSVTTLLIIEKPRVCT